MSQAQPVKGRWPANVVHDGSAEVLAGFPISKDGVAVAGYKTASSIYGTFMGRKHDAPDIGYGGQGSAARFFACCPPDEDDELSEATDLHGVTLYLGDCLDILRQMPDNSIDALVTDPPAGIGFMGKEWDHDKGGRDAWVSWLSGVMRECLRVLKPGAHALVWALPRTSHWTGWALEEAGFEIRDRIAHLFGSGFPKSLDVSKAIDKMAGAEREVVGEYAWPDGNARNTLTHQTKRNGIYSDIKTDDSPNDRTVTAPATPAAVQWQGWGTALKPACEDWWLCRKPLAEGTVAANVLEWGTGAINIDATRIPTNGEDRAARYNGKPPLGGMSHGIYQDNPRTKPWEAPPGRFPANVTHDGSEEVLVGFPMTTSGAKKPTDQRKNGYGADRPKTVYGTYKQIPCDFPADSGSAARFFYQAKASRADRNDGLDSTCTVKYNVPITGGALCRDVSTVLAESLRKATSESAATWLIGESGESIMGLCPSASLSTTLTAISRITTSQILNSLTPSLISAFTPVANCETVNGGSLAESAESSSGSRLITTSESLEESARGASLAVSQMLSQISDAANWKPLNNFHATVKPISLMRWLCRLITPPGGTVLDCFMGSGSTGKACALEGFGFIGIELDPEYFEIAKRRIEHVQHQPQMVMEL